ncbi:sugar fermentation stimulation protein A [Anaerotignum neopropionicum]|uniref:Sugar fermentation stimulation protein homolog n=1 Tax=Anaerotignum neopropionicum TaxID=36847 RepID=A0A136WD10_9FIRM|nr:DNA/RNA nuclease SfsA [Anaerotignum neopropionicum]KXL52374.1 sugar fermentation stimulation protein A [Anaerotignum neopropionicum]
MVYKNMKEAVFLRRENRFSAFVYLEGKETQVHVKNTGRCRELLQPGARVYLEPSDNPQRKTKYSLISVYKGNMLVNMDSQAPNQVVAEAMAEGRISEIGEVSVLRREVTYGNSRFDLYFEAGMRRGFIEVKGATLEENGICRFPDAPTLRGQKHILELIRAKEEGFEAYVFFVIQMKGAKVFYPHWERDAAFSEALVRAKEAGVEILAYDCIVDIDALQLSQKVFSKIERKT